MRYTIVIIWQKTVSKKLSQTIKKSQCVEKGKQKCTTRMAIQIGRGKVNAKKIDFCCIIFVNHL